MNPLVQNLSDSMRESLNQPGSFVVLSTIDHAGFPSLIPVGSLVSRSPTLLLMGLRQSLRSLANIQANPNVGILHISHGNKAKIKGLATIHGEIPASDAYFGIPCRIVAVRVTGVESIATGVSVQPFVYWTWGVKHLEALDSIRKYLLSVDPGSLAPSGT
ncbi:MAG: pyridoxamine 5'-phosphate oxidase family protein [Bacillota bacterium]|nr:pyridoxamine 5'-phosphate oxidase family protein [Bacillota bacterium]